MDLRRATSCEPTVFTDVRPDDARHARGDLRPGRDGQPVLHEEEAIALANDTRFGLAAGVWTRDVKRAHRVAAAVHAGVVWVNTYGLFDAAVPYGGFR